MLVVPIVLASLFTAPAAAAPQLDEVADVSADADNGPPADAMEEFRRGRTLYAKAQFEEALVAFQRADNLHPAADLQYNIALCHMRLENWGEAIAGFEVYLRTKKDPPDRADVEARIAEARRHLARAEEAVESAPPPQPEVLRDVAAADADLPPSPTKPWAGFVGGGAALLGVGAAAAIGGGTGFGIALSRKNDELDAIVSGGNPQQVGYAEAEQLEREAERLRMLQWVSIGVGSGMAITGAVLLAVGLDRRRDARRIAVTPNLRGISIRGRF
jgi:tetratricopeptide (TPR) repeat protein